MYFFSYFHSLNYDKFIDLFSLLILVFVAVSPALILHTASSSPSANPPGRYSVGESVPTENRISIVLGLRSGRRIGFGWMESESGGFWRGAVAAGGVDIDI